MIRVGGQHYKYEGCYCFACGADLTGEPVLHGGPEAQTVRCTLCGGILSVDVGELRSARSSVQVAVWDRIAELEARLKQARADADRWHKEAVRLRAPVINEEVSNG